MMTEVGAFSNLFDDAFTFSTELSGLTKTHFNLKLFTDSKSLFDQISKGIETTEKRLMVDVASAKNGFRSKDSSNDVFVLSGANLEDGFTKPMSQSSLSYVVQLSSHTFIPVQWII